MNGSQSAVPGTAASALPGNLVEMQTLRAHPRLTESTTLVRRFRVSQALQRIFNALTCLRITALFHS